MIAVGVLVFLFILYLVYLFGVIYNNGFESKYRQFRVVSLYGDKERHLVQWKLFFSWHTYITDSYYMDTAEFESKEEAFDFIRELNKKENVEVKISYYEGH